MIRLDRISKSFGRLQALDDVSLEMRPGVVVMVAGADGAGKSTLLKAAVGLVRITKGCLFFRERRVTGRFREVRRATGYMPEKFSLYPDLTVGETMRFVADIHGLPPAEGRRTALGLLDRTGLGPFVDRRAAELSGGMRQKLALCVALVPSPDVLVLDEPTAGIDPLSRLDVARLVGELKSEGKAILMSTSDLHEAEMADEVLYLKNGRTIVAGDVRRLKAAYPDKILRLFPRGNALDLLPMLLDEAGLRAGVIIRGNALYCRKRDFEELAGIPLAGKEELPASLEDICLFAEHDRERSGRA